MRTRSLLLALSGILLLLASARAAPLTYTQIAWEMYDNGYVNPVQITSPPDANGECITQYISEPQYAANVELAADVRLTDSGLLMKGWAVQGNEDYTMASLRLTAIEQFVATATGTLPSDLALKVNLEINASAFVSEKFSPGGDPLSNYLTFSIAIQDSNCNKVAQWTNPAGKIPTLTLASDLDAGGNPYYWMARDWMPNSSVIQTYDNGCTEDICPDDDLSVIDYYVPFDGAYVEVSESPSMILPGFQPDEKYRLIIHATDVIGGMGAIDLWNTIEFGETPFVFGTLSGGAFTPLSPEDQAKLTLWSDAGALGAVPEPSTLAIWSVLALCGIGIGWRRRRKDAQQPPSHNNLPGR